MLHILIIVLFMVVVLHDALGLAPSPMPSMVVWAAALGPMAVLALSTWAILATLNIELRRRGSMGIVMLADRILGVSRWAAVLLHASGVLAVGLLGEVRARIGDVVAIDELLVIAPPIAVFLIGWWAYEPIERAVREAVTLRLLDAGEPVFRAPSRREYVVLNLRHQVLLSLVPIGLIAVWTEGVQRVLSGLVSRKGDPGALGRAGLWLSDPDRFGWVFTAAQLAGVALVFALSPLVLRRVWDTVRLAPGPLRSRLAAICDASRVKIRDLLVWRTHGTMINGAVIGLVGPLRYILLTDALLEHLSTRQVEAVMAHEVGHARHRHMPWLAMAMMVGVMGGAILLSLAAWAAVQAAPLFGPNARAVAGLLEHSLALEAMLAIGSLMLGLVWFGFVSRRFEWQADAFAVQQLSRIRAAESDAGAGPTLWDVGDPAPPDRAREPGEGVRITGEAVEAMTDALDAVAELNRMPRNRRSWRHGSIAYRQQRLRQMRGAPADRLKIDRTVRWLKIGLALGIGAVVGLAIWTA